MNHFATIISNVINWLSFLALALLIIGLINPRWVLPFLKEKNRNRSSSIYGIVIIFCIAAQFILGPSGFNLVKFETSETTSPSTEETAKSLPKCLDPVAGSDQRSTKDLPDDSKDKQFHFIYVVPKGAEDRHLDTDGRIATTVSGIQNWLCNQTGGKYFHLDTYQGKLDVSFIQLSETQKELEDAPDMQSYRKTAPAATVFYIKPVYFEVANRLPKFGFNNPNKIYVVIYEGGGYDDVCGATFVFKKIAMMFLKPNIKNGAFCGADEWAKNYLDPVSHDFFTAHEMIHALGAVNTCSPHYVKGSHVVDSNHDIMFSEGSDPQQRRTDWINYPILDDNHDDYYDAHISNCPDVARSAFLEGGGKEMPLDLINKK
jgi:hypothetical protein